MKKFIFTSLFALVFVFSCEEDEITTPSYDKHYIQYDSCWVEITDTIQINAECFYWEKANDYKVINDNNTYINFQYHEYMCKTTFFPAIDFSKKTLLAYLIRTQDYWDSVKFKLYRNDCIREYLFLAQISSPEGAWIDRFFQVGVITSKLKYDYLVRFDTVYVH